MKTRNLLWAGLIGLIVVLFGCKKELPELSEESVSQVNLTVQEFISFDWTNEERRFFELNSGLSDLKNQDIQNRGVEGSVIYHPEVIHLYNTIARQNEEDLFIENIVENVGLPVWRYAIVNEDEESQEKLVILPLIDAQQGKTNAIITSWKTSGNYVINAHTRESLLDIQSDDIERKIAFLEALAYYDSFLFDDKQGESVEALCRYNDSLNPSNDPSNLPPDSPDCSWNVLVICSDLNTQTTWFGGVSNMPPHLDHDGDGIINGEDQDFLSLGITQDQFEGWLREWWLQNEYEHLGDYDQYFQNNGGGSWYNDYEEIMEFWEGIWQDMWLDWQDQIYDAWYDDHGYDDPRDPWDERIYACGGGWYDPLDSPIEEREVRCFAYYVLDCGVGEFDIDNWQDVFSDYVPCLECPSYEDIFMERAFDYYDTHSQGFSYSFNSFDDLVQAAEMLGCNGASPTFEQCINEAAVLSTFGLDYNTLLSQAAINWLIDRPVYPEGPDRIYVVARYIHLQGGTEEAKTHAKNVLNWITSLNGFSPNKRELDWLLENPEGFEDLTGFKDELDTDEDWDEYANTASILTIQLLAADELIGTYGNNFGQIIEHHGLSYDPVTGLLIAKEVVLLREQYPNASDAWIALRATRNVLSEQTHLLLDMAGLIPGAGEFADLANGVIYALEGNWFNASVSVAAAVPILGWTATGLKFAAKPVIGASGRRLTLKYIVNESTGIIKFGDRGQLRRLLKTPSGHQAHHIVPWSKTDHPVIQKAANAGESNVFHPNEVFNGINLPNARHNGSHPNYNFAIETRLNQWAIANPNASSQEAASSIRQWLQSLKVQIESSTAHINDIVPPPIPNP